MKFCRYFRSGALLLAVACSSHAAEYTETPTHKTTHTQSQRLQNSWQISDEDWRKYQKIMAGRRGQLSPNLEPFIALGTETNDPQERRRYAEKYVQAEFDRVERELAFQREVTAAWARLFPDTPAILDVARANQTIGDSFKAQAQAATASRQALVLKKNCRACDKMLDDMIARIDQTGLPKILDIYLQGETEEAAIRAWVSEKGLPITWIQSGRMTVNTGQSAPKAKAPSRWALLNNGHWTQIL